MLFLRLASPDVCQMNPCCEIRMKRVGTLEKCIIMIRILFSLDKAPKTASQSSRKEYDNVTQAWENFTFSPSVILTNNHVNQSDYMLVPFISGIQCIFLRYNVEITSKRMNFFRGGDAIMVNMYFSYFSPLKRIVPFTCLP